MAFQSTAAAINLWRFLAGIGLGVEMITIGAYVSELAPKNSRGAAFAFNQFLSFSRRAHCCARLHRCSSPAV